MSHRVLIVDDLHPSFMAGLDGMKVDYDYLPGIDRAGIEERIGDYTVLVIRTKTNADQHLIEKGTQLRVIARAGSGMDNIDESFATARGIKCINAPEANRDAVAEHALGMLLALTRNICTSSRQVRNYQWLREANRGRELTEMVVGIIGFGNTGSAFAQKLSSMGCETLFYDKFLRGITTFYAKESLWPDIREKADVISFHIPLDKENAGIINKELISSFKKPVILLNLSRGGIMKTEDVVWGLETGRISAAALDVLENEKLPTMSEDEKDHFEYLSHHANVIITPHIAGWTTASYRKISEVLLWKLRPLLG